MNGVTKNNRLIQTFNEMTPRYEVTVDHELQRFWGWSYRDFVDRLINTIPIRETDLILDVATGTAVIPRRLQDQNKIFNLIIGLDITLEMLKKASKQNLARLYPAHIELTCADAMVMPFRDNVFDVIICGLATHHMDIANLLSETKRVLKPGGFLAIADVGGSLHWQVPGVKRLIKLATFIYFLIMENFKRAWIEATAVPNVFTPDEWQSSLGMSGFDDIRIIELPKSHTWIPSPLLITAKSYSRG
jgi:ubiquinone/menaquinone biosynthesis C-methylase UbiE